MASTALRLKNYAPGPAVVFGVHAEPMGTAIAGVARENEKFYDTMMALATGTAYSALVVEVLLFSNDLFAVYGFNPVGMAIDKLMHAVTGGAAHDER